MSLLSVYPFLDRLSLYSALLGRQFCSFLEKTVLFKSRSDLSRTFHSVLLSLADSLATAAMTEPSSASVGGAPVTRTESQGPFLVSVAIGFVITSSSIMILRLYNRIAILKKPGIDDWTMLAAVVSPAILAVSRTTLTERSACLSFCQSQLAWVGYVYNPTTTFLC
jgi:hypothetical protein